MKRHSRCCEDEELTPFAGRERNNGRRRQTIAFREAAHGPPIASDQTIRGSKPKHAGGRFGQGAYIVACEDRGVLVCVVAEADGVEACDAAFGRKPKVAVTRLQDLVNAGLWQTFFGGPCLVIQKSCVLGTCAMLLQEWEQGKHEKQADRHGRAMPSGVDAGSR